MNLFSLLKKFFYAIILLLASIILLFSIAWASLQSEYIQTKAVNFFASQLSSSLKADVHIEHVGIAFFNRIVLEGVLVKTSKGDTVISSKKIYARLRSFSIKRKIFDISTIALVNPEVHIKADKYGNVNIADWFSNVSKTDTTQNKWLFKVSNVKLENARFSFLQDGIQASKSVFDYQRTIVDSLSCSFENIKIRNTFTIFDIIDLTCKERCGFKINELKSQVFLSAHSINFYDFSVLTPLSEVKARFIHMGFKSYSGFKDFLTSVTMDSKIEPSKVSMKDISFFTDALAGLDQIVHVTGTFKGTVSDFAVTNLDMSLLDSTRLMGKVEISGLPDIKNSYFFIDVKRLKTTISDIASIPMYPFTSGEKIPVPKSYFKFGNIRYTGNFTGLITDLVSYGNITTSLGNISSDILIKTIKDKQKIDISGNFSTQCFNLGKLLDASPTLGNVDMNVKINSHFNTKSLETAELIGSISTIEFNQYSYQNVNFSGNLSPKMFDGIVTIKDKNLDLDFKGLCDFSKKLPSLNFTANVEHMNPYKLKYGISDSLTNISFNLHSKLTGNRIENMNGIVSIDSLLFENKKGQAYISNAKASIENTKNNESITFESDFLKAKVWGNFRFNQLQPAITKTLSKILPTVFNDNPKNIFQNNEKVHFAIEIKNLNKLTPAFIPKFSISNNSKLTGDFNLAKNTLNMSGDIPFISYGTNKISNLTISAQTDQDKVLFNSEFDMPVFNVAFKDISISGELHNDSIITHYKWFKKDSLVYAGNIKTVGSFIKKNAQVQASFTMLPSDVTIADSVWSMSKSFINMSSEAIAISGFSFHNNSQILNIDGIISKNNSDSLLVNVSNFDTKYFNKFIKSKDYEIKGILNGYIALFQIPNNFHFQSKITASDFVIANNEMGTLFLLSAWDNTKQAVDVDFYTQKGKIKPINITGVIYPEDEILDLNAEINNANVNLLSLYTKIFASDLKGYLNGQVRIFGKINNPEMQGYVDLKKVSLVIDYLKTRYNLSGRCNVTNQKIDFNNIQVFDSEGNPGIVTGNLEFEKYKNFTYNIVVDFKNFMVLNTKASDNNYFYGKAFATGVAKIQGDLSHTQIDGSAKSTTNSIIYIPVNSQSSVEENNFLTFKNKSNLTVKKAPESTFDGIVMNFDLDVTPDAEIQIILDEKVGDIIKSNGSGTVMMNIDTKGKFNMYGTYEIQNGDYLFTMHNLVNKKFDIEQGSKLTWNGDPLDAIADITAIYRVRTSVFPLMSFLVNDTADDYKRRIPIDCKIILTDKILSPNIAFFVDMKDADEKAREVFNNLSQDEKDKQFMTLLVLNSFFFENLNQEQTTALNKTSMEVFSNQLSNLASNINKDINVGINYRPGAANTNTNDELEIAMSTELLKNRVIVNVNSTSQIRNSQNQNPNQQTTDNGFMGDVIIEVKLNKKGTLRARGFSRSNADNLTKKSDTQGSGLSFSQSFNTLADLFRGNKKREKIKKTN